MIPFPFKMLLCYYWLNLIQVKYAFVKLKFGLWHVGFCFMLINTNSEKKPNRMLYIQPCKRHQLIVNINMVKRIGTGRYEISVTLQLCLHISSRLYPLLDQNEQCEISEDKKKENLKFLFMRTLDTRWDNRFNGKQLSQWFRVATYYSYILRKKPNKYPLCNIGIIMSNDDKAIFLRNTAGVPPTTGKRVNYLLLCFQKNWWALLKGKLHNARQECLMSRSQRLCWLITGHSR